MKLNSGTQLVLAALVLIGTATWAIKEKQTPLSRETADTKNNSFVVRHARLFDGEQFSDDRDIWVQNGLIKAVGTALTVPSDLPQIDATGKTVMPGLIDAHTHSFGDARRDALRFGVTTELDMFGDIQTLPAAKQQRENINYSEQADLWSAGILATAPGGHGTEYGAIPTLSRADEAHSFVQARVNEGSDYIKVVLDDGHVYGAHSTMNSLTADVSQALINAAHQQEKLALFHIASRADAQQATAQGADGLVHLFSDTLADVSFIATAKQRDIFVVPTLSVVASMAASDEGNLLANDTAVDRYLTAAQRSSLQKRFPAEWQNAQRMVIALENVKRLHDAGVVLLAGTDAGNPGTAHGASLHGELALLVRAGLTPIAALRAATALPARYFKLADRGRIAVGLRADLIMLDGDPSRDIHVTRNITQIWKNGYAISRELAANQASATSAPPSDTTISDFEQKVISSRYGKGWISNTDHMMNGTSIASLALATQGADSSQGALQIRGEIKPGFAYPWAGAMFVTGQDKQAAVNFSNATELIFWTKGDGREYTVMTFASSNMGGIPPSQRFISGQNWQEVRLRLNEFAGLDLNNVAAISFVATAPHGPFEFMIDNVHIE